MHSLFVLCAIIFFYNIGRRVWKRFYHLSAFPGPRLAGYTRFWLLRTYASGNSQHTFLEVNRRFGRLARIAPNTLLTDDPDIHFKILDTHSKFRRGKWFDSLRFDPHFTSIASETDPEKHGEIRRKVAAGYATKDFPELEQIVDNRVEYWIQRLRQSTLKSSIRRAKIDIGRTIRHITLDMAAHICFSQGMGFGDENEQEVLDFQESMEQNAPYAQYLSTAHGLFSTVYAICCIPGMKDRTILTENNNPGIGKVLRISRLVTAQRFSPDAKPVDDMLGSWIKKGLTHHEAETEISIALVTGAFPTAAAINAMLLHIGTNSRIYTKLMHELETAMSGNAISAPVTNAQAMKFPYFQACVAETLRRFPPITQLREREVPQGGYHLDGRFVPEGTNVGLNTWALQRHACFGDDPEIFFPERWLEADENRLVQMKKIHSLIFGHGGTKCLGIPQATMILNKVLIEVMRNFSIEVLDPSRPWIDQCNGVSFHKEFFVRLEERQRAETDT